MGKDLYWYDWTDEVLIYLNEAFADSSITELQLHYDDVAANIQVDDESISQ